MVDIVFGLCDKLVKHVVHIVTCRRLMAVRVAMMRRIGYPIVRMDIVVGIVDWAEKIWIEGGIRIRER